MLERQPTGLLMPAEGREPQRTGRGDEGIPLPSFQVDFGEGSIRTQTAAATFTRATIATVDDNEQVVRNVLSSEARFQGLRRVENRLSNSSLTTWAAGLPTGWLKGANVTLTEVTGWDGTGSAARYSASNISNNGLNRFSGGNHTFVTGNTYRISARVRRISGSLGELYIAWDGVGTSLIVPANASTNWIRYASGILTGISISTGQFGFYVETSTDSVWEIDDVQLEDITAKSVTTPSEYVSTGVLSTPYHGANVDGVKYFPWANGNTVSSNVVSETQGAQISNTTRLGYLAEGARTNLCLQSEVFDNASWTKNGSTVSANALAAPDGTTTADAILDTAANVVHEVTQSITKAASNLTYAVTVWAKFGTIAALYMEGANAGSTAGARTTFDLQAGTAGAVSTFGAGFTATASAIKAYPNGWYRCELQLTSDTDTTLKVSLRATNGAYLGTGAIMFYLWGAQVEQAAFASTYIPTTTASATRNADVMTYPTTGWFSTTSGSILTQGTILTDQNPAFSNFVNINDNTNNEVFRLGVETTEVVSFLVQDGGAQQAAVGTRVVTAGVQFNAAIAWATNDFAITVNGQAVEVDTSGTLPTVTDFDVGNNQGGGQAFGPIRRVAYWPIRVPNGTLQNITR